MPPAEAFAAPAQPLPIPPIPLEPVAATEALAEPTMATDPSTVPQLAIRAPGPDPIADAPQRSPHSRTVAPALVTPTAPLPIPGSRAATNGHAGPGPRPNARPAPGGAPVGDQQGDEPVERGATGPQLRRFIKSRAYVPMHELRRRFVINGGDDDVTPVDLGERRRVFVGLPEREGRLLGELLQGGDIGYELSLDPISPIVVGVYPMRPVTRA